MKRSTAIILAALLLSTAALSGCAQSGNNNAASAPSDTSTAASSQDSSAAESTESEISDTESSVVSEAASAESSEENSKTSKAESSDNKSKTESSKTKTEEKSKPESSKPETSKTETSKTETSKTETSKTETLKTETSKTETSKAETSKTETSKTETSKTETSKTETSKTEEVKATGISIDLSTLSLTAGYGHELNAYILWSNGTSSYNGITWSSSNSSVASVSSSGYVTAKSAGTATITASYGSFKQSCKVTVKAAQVSQHSQPSGGSSGGNRGSTSKPSGGGSSQTTKPSTPTETSKPSETSSTDNYYDAKYYPKGDFFKSHGCPVVKTMSGRTTYDITAYILPTINKYRQQEGKQTLVADTYEHEYNFLCDYGQYLKNNRPRRAERIKAGEDSNFNSNFKPKSELFNRDIYNEGVVELANCIELASAGGHGDGHGANILTDWGNFDMDRGIGGMKQRSSSHWSSLMDSDATSVKVILWISNEDAALGNQGYHLAIAMGWDDFDSCGW